MENINGVSGSGVSLKTSTFILVLMRTVWEHAAAGCAVKPGKLKKAPAVTQW